MTIRNPKSARSGRPLAFRVDFPPAVLDSQGNKKLIIDPKTQAEAERWKRALNTIGTAAGGTGPHSGAAMPGQPTVQGAAPAGIPMGQPTAPVAAAMGQPTVQFPAVPSGAAGPLGQPMVQVAAAPSGVALGFPATGGAVVPAATAHILMAPTAPAPAHMPPTATELVWQWESGQGVWATYKPDVAQKLSTGFAEGERNVDFETE